MKKILKSTVAALAFCAALHHQSVSAQALALDTNLDYYSQNFDAIGTSYPNEWLVYSNATSAALGTLVTVNTTAKTWATTSFSFANYASTMNGGTNFLGTEDTATQTAATNRCLGVRTTGSNDPGDAFALKIGDTLGLVNFKLDLDFLLLSVQTRTNIWTVDYGFGATPTSFTVADATQNYIALSSNSVPVGTFGATHRTISFGSALDNNAGPVWIRIVNLAPSGGSGNRPTVGIDNVLLSYTNAPATASSIVITSQPHGETNNAGTSASFTVAVTGTSPAFQWYQIDSLGNTNQLTDGGTASGDGSSYSGTQSQTLSVNNVFGAEAARFFVNITNAAPAGNNTNSAVVTLGVNDPVVSASPGNMTNVLNDVDYFAATAVGTPGGQLYWYYNGNVISNVDFSGITNATTIFVVNNPAATNLTGYYLVASNQFGMATSAVATASIAVTPPVELVRWDFNDTTDYSPTNFINASLGIGIATPVPNPAVSNFIFAPGALFDPNELSGGANDAWELDGFPAGIANKTAGFQFNLSTLGYTNIFLTWSERHSATASKYMRVQFTTNGTDWVDGDVLTFNAVLYQFYSSDLSGKPGVANNTHFGFRIVAEWEGTAINDANNAYAGTTSGFGAGGTIRVDLMTVFGAVIGSGPIPLAIRVAGTNAILSWTDPTSAFGLQSATQAVGPYSYLPGAYTNSPYTNPIAGAKQFFRLKSN